MTDQNVPDVSTLMPAMAIGTLIISLIAVAIALVIYWKIFSKAGFSGWLSLTMLIPLVNFIMMLYLAFGEWPVLRELKELKQGKSQTAFDA